MVYLFLSVCCSLAVAAIFKYNETRGWNRSALLTANYWAATAAAALVFGGTQESGWTAAEGEIAFWSLILVTGSLFISTYFILAWATNVAGMGLATGIMRVSVVVPVVASWAIWSEQPTPAQMVGLLLAVAAFFCIAVRRRSIEKEPPGATASVHPIVVFSVLLLLFVSGGVVDTCIKLFDEEFAGRFPETLFLVFVYLVAAGIGTAITGWRYAGRRELPARGVVTWGVLLGLCNYGATLFFLRAVARLAAPFVFPANSLAIVLGAALIGVYAWGENLSRLNWIGLAMAGAALVLLRV